MMIVEKLKLKNITIVEELFNQNFNSFNQSFLELFYSSKGLEKYALKNNFYLIKHSNNYIGYIWIEKLYTNEYRILDISISPEYLDSFDLNSLRKLKQKLLIFEGINNFQNKIIMKNNNFTEVKTVKLLKRNLENFFKETQSIYNIQFKQFKIGLDENIRVELQNSIFYNINRTPLNELDIKFEQQTINYINKLAIIQYFDNIPIGYGQIIKKNNKYILVNFGVKKEYRGLGFGKIFLIYMCNLAKENNIDALYVYVDSNNFKAYSLYKSLGFNLFGNINTWVRD